MLISSCPYLTFLSTKLMPSGEPQYYERQLKNKTTKKSISFNPLVATDVYRRHNKGFWEDRTGI